MNPRSFIHTAPGRVVRRVIIGRKGGCFIRLNNRWQQIFLHHDGEWYVKDYDWNQDEEHLEILTRIIERRRRQVAAA